eukprot:1136272-Pelagomonas_calceolata.AAC.3
MLCTPTQQGVDTSSPPPQYTYTHTFNCLMLAMQSMGDGGWLPHHLLGPPGIEGEVESVSITF